MAPHVDKAAFADMMPAKFFFELAADCHRIFRSSPDKELPERVQIAIATDPIKQDLLDLCSRFTNDLLPERNLAAIQERLVSTLPEFVLWLSYELQVVSDEIATKYEAIPLNFLPHSDPSSPWHNLATESARRALSSAVTTHLSKRFQRWNKDEITEGLTVVPPFCDFKPEYSDSQQTARSRFSLQWVVAFLRSEYLLYLGHDPLPAHLGKTHSSHLDSTIGLWDELKHHPGRHTHLSHSELFDQIKYQPPFRDAYAEAQAVLAPLYTNKNALEDDLKAITFKSSLPYARDLIKARGLYEQLTNTLQSGATTLAWVVSYAADLTNYFNPMQLAETDLLEIAYYYPVVAELFDIAANGTEELEGHTPLDNSRSAPDEEFDD